MEYSERFHDDMERTDRINFSEENMPPKTKSSPSPVFSHSFC